MAFAYSFEEHPRLGQRVVRLSDGERTTARFAPGIGSNLFSFQVEGLEYLYDMADAPHSPLLGTPILYPMPNRVRDAQFTFGGRTFRFPPNNGRNFIHGLVRERPWQCDEPIVAHDRVSVATRISFAPGKEPYDLFPIHNTLELTYTLRSASIRFDFVVRNEDEQPLPFGLAIHPYFRILGPRESVRLQVPAQKWMEATELLPSGRLIDLEHAPADLRQPTSLAKLDLDDVYWGLEPSKPQIIYYDHIGKKVTLKASALFTHSVVYTPLGRPFFCVENQSCSTDAHNLYARDLQEAAHLMILKPGESCASWVEIAVDEQ